MINGPYIAEIAALIGDPGRANILAALMDGRALTASELALIAGVSPSTASGHLAKLTAGQLIALEVQGRHRYYRLANPLVAEALESIMALALTAAPRHRPPAKGEAAIRLARTCYDHLAGRLGVALTASLVDAGHIAAHERRFDVTRSGERFLGEFGIDLGLARGARRTFAKPCLDWSERRHHMAGALGAAIAARCFELGWVERMAQGRALHVTKAGHSGLEQMLDITLG